MLTESVIRRENLWNSSERHELEMLLRQIAQTLKEHRRRDQHEANYAALERDEAGEKQRPVVRHPATEISREQERREMMARLIAIGLLRETGRSVDTEAESAWQLAGNLLHIRLSGYRVDRSRFPAHEGDPEPERAL